MKVIKYPDESSYYNLEQMTHRSVVTFKINTYEDLWHLNQFVDAFHSRFEVAPVIFIPNLIDAQADRRFDKSHSHGLKLVCKFLNGIKAKFIIFHPHNPEVVEALMDNVEIKDNTAFINQVLSSKLLKDERHPARLKDEYFVTKQGYHVDKRVSDNLILMSSDAGGFKPLMRLCDKIGWEGETYSASKYRANHGVEFKLYQEVDRQDFQGKDILIIDDICVYGGTFKGLSKLLKDRNCGKLYLAVSHMTVQNLGEDPVTNYFAKVFTTNSKYDEYFAGGKTGNPDISKSLEIIKLF